MPTGQESLMPSIPSESSQTPAVLRVLHVEDSPPDAGLVRRVLESAGLRATIRVAGTLPEVEQALAGELDVVLTDYDLGSFSGREVLALVAKLPDPPPAIVVTGALSEELAVGLLKAGAADYVLKTHLASLPVAMQEAVSQRRFARARREAERRLAQLWEAVEQAPAVICIVDGQGTIEFVNPEFCRFSGFRPEEVLGQPASVLRSRLVPPLEYRAILKAVASEGAWHGTASGRDAAGRPVFALMSVSAVWTPSGELSGQVVAVGKDVTDSTLREQADHAVNRLLRALQASEDSPEAVAAALVAQVAECCPSAGIWVLGLPDQSGTYPVLAARAETPGPHHNSVRAGELLARLEQVREPVVGTGLPFQTEGEPAPAEGRRTLGVPLGTREEPVGSFWLMREEGLAERGTVLSPDEMMLLDAMAPVAAAALVRARARVETERRLERLATMKAITQAIAGTLDQRLVLNVIVDAAPAQLGMDASAILLLDPRTRRLHVAADRGVKDSPWKRDGVRLGEGLVGRAALERRVVGTAEGWGVAGAGLATWPGAAPVPGAEPAAAFAAPMVAKGQVIGTFAVFRKEPMAPDPEWLEFLQALADQAAVAIDSARLFQDLQRSNDELALAYDATIEGWVKAIDLRDKETEGHTRRVTAASVALGRALGLDPAELVQLRRGALLHDVGKMAIPDAILHKPGSLTPEERRIMEQHTVYAHQWLSPIAFLRPAVDVPYCHHERLDGSGYPRGLKGEQIPLPARIFAVVDVWDALRSDRVYRPAWSEAKVLDHLRAEAGAHLDRSVVEAFLPMVE